jgi:hypothetical protein
LNLGPNPSFRIGRCDLFQPLDTRLGGFQFAILLGGVSRGLG